MLTNCLAACTHLSSTVSQLFEPQVQKNRRFHVPQPTFFVSAAMFSFTRARLNGVHMTVICFTDIRCDSILKAAS